MTFVLKDKNRGTEREFDTRAEAEEKKEDMRGLGAAESDLEIINETSLVESDTDVVEQSEESAESDVPEKAPEDALDELGEELETDPLSILPGHMVDQIQGKPAINKRGYAMIAERYDVSVKAEIETYPWENDEKRCVAKAVAVTEDGKEYQDFATASDADGDMPEQIIELASTRALKRVTGWATGLGIVSYQELSNQLEGEQ
jgi:hypothetical protein